MKKLTITIAALITLGLAACDKPTVVNVPAENAPAETVIVPVPGPAGEKGATGDSGNQGATGDQGVQGEQGETGGDTTIIVPQQE
ncbi:MAG: hypothetical protein V4605_08440 [Pseudomonadota bacterium]